MTGAEIRFQDTVSSPLGPLTLIATRRGISRVLLGRRAMTKRKSNRWIRLAEKELNTYFKGTRSRFTVPLDIAGSHFQRRVWLSLSGVRFGNTIAYGALAKRSGHPKASRAVGNAVGKNPVPILIPCHRVIRKNGAIGGFSSPLRIKHSLLKLEGVQF